MVYRINHSFDRVPHIEPWHVEAARRIYSIYGGNNLRGLEKAIYYTQTHQCVPAVIHILKTLLDCEREKVAKQQRLEWRPMR